ncbi:DUF1499 domain-containing protein [Sulfitobacter noctilucicola]|uniref:DUF1499 domain-containing protein n=1 Tax=Sulfitobacter noctilucicola TaxID=1342301 RepID=A0A7W6Q3A9_9RHOB|nr:DUF1499 domain-containing protein [Sulfitobacter noctilucicola]MBB4173990.1 hypothetical protein [Sulfitobacter noctilucicola]
MIFWILVLVVIGVFAFVRLAPSDPQRWHRQSNVAGMGESRPASGYVWREPVTDDGLARLKALDDVIRDTPRTKVLIGSVAEGKITYVTRSKVCGFPDYTTIGIYEGPVQGVQTRYLEINARLRFGKSDLGVNRNRVQGWIASVEG